MAYKQTGNLIQNSILMVRNVQGAMAPSNHARLHYYGLFKF